MDLFTVRTISFCRLRAFDHGPQRTTDHGADHSASDRGIDSKPVYGSLPIVTTFTLSDRRWRWRVRQSFHETVFLARKPGNQCCFKKWIRVTEISGHSFARSRKVLRIKKLGLSPADRGANDQSVHKRLYIFASRKLPFLSEIKRQIMEDNCS
jgi:hypothetical protein